jgi:hypothetical protein
MSLLARKPAGQGWIGVDLDGTIAEYTEWKGATVIGRPLGPMLMRVKLLLEAGYDVRIFTARISEPDPAIRRQVIDFIDAWCVKYIGEVLPITNVKDYDLIELYDDRARQMVPNTGQTLQERLDEIQGQIELLQDQLAERA